MEIQPPIKPGVSWDLFDNAELKYWLNDARRQRKEERGRVVEIGLKYRRIRKLIEAIEAELARRGEPLQPKED